MITYKITNKTNGHFYIGMTTATLESRWYGHQRSAIKRNSPTYFHNAIRKYGASSFICEILQSANSFEELNLLEYNLIKELKPKYNSKDGGIQGKLSEATKIKISKSLSGRVTSRKGKPGPKLTQEAKDKLRAYFTGRPRKPHSEETKNKMSLSKVGNTNARRKDQSL